MAVRTRDELISRISEYIGEDNSDAAIEIIEDVTDTINDLSSGEDWHARYDELDRTWRERYRARFEGGDELPTGDRVNDDTHEEVKDEEELLTYEDFYDSISVEE